MDRNGKSYIDLIGLELDSPTAGLKRRNQAPDNNDNTVCIERVEEHATKKIFGEEAVPIEISVRIDNPQGPRCNIFISGGFSEVCF